jgi:hypothetical protein
VLSHEVRLYSDQRQAAMVEALLAFRRPYVIRYHGPVSTDSVFTEQVDRYFKLGASIGLHRLLIPRGSAVTLPQHWW